MGRDIGEVSVRSARLMAEGRPGVHPQTATIRALTRLRAKITNGWK